MLKIAFGHKGGEGRGSEAGVPAGGGPLWRSGCAGFTEEMKQITQLSQGSLLLRMIKEKGNEDASEGKKRAEGSKSLSHVS